MYKRSVVYSSEQRGFTLIEALIAVLVLSFGLLAIGTFQAKLVAGSAYNKARAEAVALAQDKLDEIRSYTTEHGIVEKLTNTSVADPALGAEYTYPADVPAGLTDYPVTPETIEGTNASFQRVWSINHVGETNIAVVTVSWTDREGTQNVSLETQIAWRNPRGSADLSASTKPLVESPTGKAYLGDGSLDQTAMDQFKADNPNSNNNDGTYTGDHDKDGDLELIVETSTGGEVVLTLPKACKLVDKFGNPICTDFVKISGTVYFDRTGGSTLKGKDIWVLASDAAYCSRWAPVSATPAKLTTTLDLTTLPGTDGKIWRDNNAVVDFVGNENNISDYDYFNYTCYLGGGWYGNIGLVMLGANNQDFACVGDPNAGTLEAWKHVELAKRRGYRGALHQYTVDANGDHVEVQVGGQTVYYSIGVKDAIKLPDVNWAERKYGHDFVISRGNNPTTTDCLTVLSRPDSDPDASTVTANLFHSVPGDFICLNEDANDPPEGTAPRVGAYAKFVSYPWDYLNQFDETIYDVKSGCDYDPSDPPSFRYTITGILDMDSATEHTWGSANPANGTFGGNINTSDGFDNCSILSTTAGDGNDISYSCNYFVWEDQKQVQTPWNGSVVVNAPYDVVCVPSTPDYTYVQANLSAEAVYDITSALGAQTANFTCHDLTKFNVTGNITVDAGNDLKTVGGLDIRAYDQNGDPIGLCVATPSPLSATYKCSGLMEDTFTSGFTGRVELLVPTDYRCTSATTINATSATCGTSVVTWSFTNLVVDPNTSSNNNVVFDGPKDVYTIAGTVRNATSPAQDILTGMVISTSDGGCSSMGLAANGIDVEYTCQVTHDTTLTASWVGSVIVNPPTGFWCGVDSKGTEISLSIPADTTATVTAASATCVVDTSGPVVVDGSVYVPTPYRNIVKYDETVGAGNGDYADIYTLLGYTSADFTGDYVMKFNSTPGTGDYTAVDFEFVGLGSGDYRDKYTLIGHTSADYTGDYVMQFNSTPGTGNYDGVDFEFVGLGKGDYRDLYTLIGNTSADYTGDYVMKFTSTPAAGDYDAVDFEFVGLGSGDYRDIYTLIGNTSADYTGDYVMKFNSTPGTGDYDGVDFEFVGMGTGDYRDKYTLIGNTSADYTGDYVMKFTSTPAAGDYDAVDFEFVGLGSGDYRDIYTLIGNTSGD
ncbi:MAG: prepilin-type N-terminal cleavage/methylation domain-containing protein, partial [Chromatiales bacterium]|nr:prepilin-type N-terminal cleavage/methylation domain-containing protein [Chromatiales bacterium]